MLRLVLIASIYITHVTSISSYSPLKKNLVSVARKLAEENEEQDADYSWLTDYSLKFSSCHTVSSLYDEEFGSYTQQLVQFRICPSDECSWRCNGGKYLVPMEDFLQGYADQKQADEDYACEQVMENCECDDNDEDDVDDGDDDGNNCEKNCYSDAGLDYCVDDDDDEAIDMLDYVECKKIGEDNDEEDDNEQNTYYGLLKCSNDGREINLGIFTDEDCTAEIENGDDGPSVPKSYATDTCFNCIDENDNEGDDGDAYEVSEICMNNYVESVKCETDMNVDNPSIEACDMIDSLHIPGDRFSSHYITAILAACIFFVSSAIMAGVVVRTYVMSKRQIELNNSAVLDLDHPESEPLKISKRKRVVSFLTRKPRQID